MCTAKDILDIVQAVVTIGAILVGGVWTYLAFVRKRLRYPRADLDVAVHSNHVPPSFRLVHVGLKVSNSGDVLLAPRYAEIRLRQVKPIPPDIQTRLRPGFDPVEPDKKELDWPLIAGREWKWTPKQMEIEPGESDLLAADFVIDDTIEIVQIYAFVQNPAKRRDPLGWTSTVMLPVSGPQAMADQDKERTELDKKQQHQQEQRE